MASEQSHVPPVTFDYLANPTTYLHVHCGAAGNQAGGAPWFSGWFPEVQQETLKQLRPRTESKALPMDTS